MLFSKLNTLVFLLSLFLSSKCEELKILHDPESEKEAISAKSFRVIQEYYENAQSLENQLDKLLEFGIYSEKIKIATDQVHPALETLGKLCDKLEALISQGKKGQLTTGDYKKELIDIDQQRKLIANEIDLFEANITSVRERAVEFDEMKEQVQEDLKFFTKRKEEFGHHVFIIQSKIELLNDKDKAIQGFSLGKEIDFDIQVLKRLQEDQEFFENLEDESFKTTTINELHDASRDMLGRYLPSIGSLTVRILEKETLVENIDSEFNKNIAFAEKLYFELHALEERYRKVVQETAIVLKEMMRDEL